MPARPARLAAALCTVLAVGLSPSPAASADPPKTSRNNSLLDSPSHGARALEVLGDKLDEAAQRNDMRVAELARLLRTDRTAWLDTNGSLYYVEAAPVTVSAAAPQAAAFPYEQTFRLHSDNTAQRTIYLDFTGHTVSGTRWNREAGVSTNPQPAYDTDGLAGFSERERDVVQSVFQRVSEDFAPFGIDVTTESPGGAALQRTSRTDSTYGIRVLITPSPQAQQAICRSTCGGVAYLGVFDATTPAYSPAWVFSNALGNEAKAIAEAATHEAGHTLGLNHDGAARQPYYGGHNIWAPIMGVGYDRPLTQWSRGEYTGANNGENDLEVMRSFGAPARRDDHADVAIAATSARISTRMRGMITSQNDQDQFALPSSCSGAVTATAAPAPNSPNLDIRLRLLNSAGVRVDASNPASGGRGRDVAIGLSARIDTSVSAGRYYVEVDGVGARNPATTGYSDYGSLGRYTLRIRGCSG